MRVLRVFDPPAIRHNRDMAKKVTCDKCGTDENVREAFMTLWNGNILDLCISCAQPIAALIDGKMKTWARRE